MHNTIKIRQVEMVAAIMRELSKQGVINLTVNTYSPLMNVCIEAANMIKYGVDKLNIERLEEHE